MIGFAECGERRSGDGRHGRGRRFSSGTGAYEVREFAIPAPPPGGAVLKVEAVGMCGSDVMQFHGQKHVPGEASPVVPGHEIVGRIHAITPEAAAAWGPGRGRPGVRRRDRQVRALQDVPGRCGAVHEPPAVPAARRAPTMKAVCGAATASTCGCCRTRT
ncbi:alcohol dehydrogenase catalytic domain-containing protein [Yinghuangia aomiensis]